MQFSVIVEGPMDSNADNEDALLELERFLRSSNIPAQVLHQLKKGQPQVLKNQLSYEQAVSISDRLMDLGLESIIDPPIKPDENKRPKVTPIKSQTPPQKIQKQRPPVAAQTAGSSLANRKVSHKPALAVVKAPAIHAKTPLRQRPPMATLESQSSVRGQTNKVGGAKLAPGQSDQEVNRAQSSATAKLASPQLAPTRVSSLQQKNSKSQAANSALSAAAAEVKSLFKLPKEGALDLPLNASTRWKMVFAGAVGVAVPAVYCAIWLSLLYVSLSLSVAVFNATAASSIVFAAVLSIFPLAMLAGLFALTHLPYFFAERSKRAELELRAKDEPRLFMLANAIGKVLKTPTPSAITLNNSSRVRAQQDSSLNDFFRLKDELAGDIQISIGAVLIECLSLRDLCSLIAKELGIYSKAQLRRPQWIIQHGMNLVQFGKAVHPEFQQRLRTLHEQTQVGIFHKALAFIAGASERLHGFTQAYFDRAHTLLKICISSSNSINTEYQLAFLGGDGHEQLLETLIHIEANHDLALEEMLQANSKSRRVNNLSDYSHYLLDKNLLDKNRGDLANTGAAKQKYSGNSAAIVASNAPTKDLLANFERYGQVLSKLAYQHAGFDLSEIELCTLQSLFKQEAKDQKFTQAANDYFSDWQHPLQFWRVPAEALLPKSSNDAVNRLNNCIARIRYVAPDRQGSLQRYDKLIKQYAELQAAKKIIASGNTFEYQRCGESARNLDRDLNQRKAQVREVQDELRQHNAIMGERLALGLMLNKQQKELSVKLFQALSACHSIGDKTLSLMTGIEELTHILRHKPKNQPQQFQLYVRELTEQIGETEKNIRKKLLHCPYDMIDRRYPNLAQFVSAQQVNHDALNLSHEQLIIHRAKDTLAAINWAYNQLNQRAAYIASAMEKQFGVETVKKLEGTTH
jgi:hypothetical protein